MFVNSAPTMKRKKSKQRSERSERSEKLSSGVLIGLGVETDADLRVADESARPNLSPQVNGSPATNAQPVPKEQQISNDLNGKRKAHTVYMASDDDDDDDEGEAATSPRKKRKILRDTLAKRVEVNGQDGEGRRGKKEMEDVKRIREGLPIAPFKEVLLKEVARRDVVVVLGETGSGKTTRAHTSYTADNTMLTTP
jgi:HrpA-like RNA helicase